MRESNGPVVGVAENTGPFNPVQYADWFGWAADGCTRGRLLAHEQGVDVGAWQVRIVRLAGLEVHTQADAMRTAGALATLEAFGVGELFRAAFNGAWDAVKARSGA
ncbi:hypothetical protein GCM10010191_61600 [Actinomadura vinacea]|uniref:Uncharacterized protein n=1 Tax=Actinomadura vinacea TaxID=115336 RepID=A0ABN3JUJ5_9ACTN